MTSKFQNDSQDPQELLYAQVMDAHLRAHNSTAQNYVIEAVVNGEWIAIDNVIADNSYDACLIGSYNNGLNISEVLVHTGEYYSTAQYSDTPDPIHDLDENPAYYLPEVELGGGYGSNV